MGLPTQKQGLTRLRGSTRRQLSAILTAAMVLGSVVPAYAGIPGIRDYDPYIRDEDAGIRYLDAYDEDESDGLPATSSDAEYATWSDAVPAAAASFNSSVEFVDSSGEILSGEDVSVPQDAKNFPYLSQQEGRTRGNDSFAEDGYVEHEYFLRGNANIYDITKDGRLATTSNAEEYINRIIVFRPENEADFNGAVFVDILNASSKTDIASLWRQSYDYIMRSGYAYVGITSKDVTAESLKTFNEDRYGVLKWGDNGAFWDMLGQLGTLLKQDNCPILYGEGGGTPQTYLFGSSQSGWYVNTFANNFGLSNFVTDPKSLDGIEDADAYEAAIAGCDHIFDGYLNSVGGMMDAPIAKKQTGPTRMFKPVRATDVPFIMLVGENDYNPAPVRRDSDAPDNKYRHYVVAGGSHSDIIFPADPTDKLQMQTGRDTREYAEFKEGHTISDFNMTVFMNAALENLHLWASEDIPAPYGPYTDEIEGKVAGMAFVPERDEYGNMTSGILSPQILVPVAGYYGGANGAFSDKHGSMVYLDEETIEALYGDFDTYLETYEEMLDRVIDAGWLLEDDKEKMMEIAESEPVFGGLGRDADAIREAMQMEPQLTELGRKTAAASGVEYRDTEYLMTGQANIYTKLTADTLVRTRHTMTRYTNYARVAVPENFSGTVVVDLILDGQGARDISSLMRQGKAYVGITAEPAAAGEKGGSWKKIVNLKTQKDEFGLVWDIISQTVASIMADDGLLAQTARTASEIQLGMDPDEKDLVYTYDAKFHLFDDVYGVDALGVTGGKELAMHGEKLETAEPPVIPDKPVKPGGSDDGGSGSSTSAPSGTPVTAGTWSSSEDGRWTFRRSDGTEAVSCWLYISWNGSNDWYYFNADGTMATGWIMLDNMWYYLHPASDGGQGRMYTGWHLIDGKWYYFHNISDGTRGHMLSGTTTPDGFQVGADGAWIE